MEGRGDKGVQRGQDTPNPRHDLRLQAGSGGKHLKRIWEEGKNN